MAKHHKTKKKLIIQLKHREIQGLENPRELVRWAYESRPKSF